MPTNIEIKAHVHDLADLRRRAEAVSDTPDQDGPKRSNYFIAETHNPAGLKTALSMALGVRGVLRKTRYLYLAGQTRIHLALVRGFPKMIRKIS